ncbi:hypothetical protein PV327_008009 [Microctonus hyperodae]|uniref:YEATS domain-containing protein 4 n=1 Tax=Microctonus hyperodae TaxID=165561 RepID=A0AA39G164_MICHY|nr:hypothetical protein PV327_008009 [Microctonus hyperodae]
MASTNEFGPDSGGRIKGLTIVKPLVYGNIARYFGKKREEDGHTHQWTVYVKPYNNEDMSIYVKKVHFKLHESYNNPNRIVTKPPYELTETGWGEFEIVIKIYFHDSNERPVTIYHILKLFQSSPEIQQGKKNLVSEFYEEIVFQDPTALMQHLLSSTRPITLGTWRHESDFEAKKESTLKAIIESRNKIRHEVIDLKEKLTLAKETIAKFKDEIAKISKVVHHLANNKLGVCCAYMCRVFRSQDVHKQIRVSFQSCHQTNKPIGVEFFLAATAAVGAGIFTNPIDVIKIRLQLQGELEARGAYKTIYKNTFHAGYVIAKHEGILALQSGIRSALAFQVVLNGIRLGSYKIGRSYGITNNDDGKTSIIKTCLLSGIAGVVGCVLGSPFYLVKTQMQAQSTEATLAVGHQHNHTSDWSAFKGLWKEAGIAGLYQRWYANIPRVFIGSATQLTTFSLVGDWLKTFSIFDGHPFILTFCSALIGGSSVALTMQPFDVISIRLYNQGTDSNGNGLLYRNFNDAFVKILKKEGLFGLYKGIFPAWMRIAPHTVLCLCFYERLDRLYSEIIY